MSKCDAIRDRLADEGATAAETVTEIKHHLEGCPDCAHFLAELRRVEAALADLPQHDAPDALVDDTLRAVRRAAEADRAPPRPAGVQRYLGFGLAASVVIAAGVGLTLGLLEPPTQLATAYREPAEANREGPLDSLYGRSGGLDQGAAGPVAQSAPSSALSENEPATAGHGSATGPESFEMADLAQKKAEQDAARSLQNLTAGGYRGSAEPLADEEARRDEVVSLLESRVEERLRDLDKREAETLAGPAEAAAKVQQPSLQLRSELKPDTAPAGTRQGLAGTGEIVGQVVGGLRSDRPGTSAEAGSEAPEAEAAPADDKRAESAETERQAAIAPGEARLMSPAAAFLHHYQSLDGLTYQDPTGYWSNSYIPGDPAMRLLQARLRDWDRSALGPDARLEQAVRPVEQPFDAPRDAAVALYLSADAAAIDGPTRLQIQIGVKGAERQGGHRPAMNVGLLVDLRDGVDAESARRIRALIDALEQARQPEDRFSLTVAGPDGGLLVPPGEFRHGPLRVAMERMFAGAGRRTAGAPGLDLLDAFILASRRVRAGDDPNAVLGSSLVLLVTGSSLSGDLTNLERMAHLNAVAGVPTSVISLAARDDLSDIDRLVAAGQGSRRILDRAQAADGLIDRELHASSQAVARALRLRIRLAPGVKLVGILGSERLDEVLAQRVREAEVAIDRRLARNLGIEPDRGEDEEGIQIVIPSFYAGDSHTILLDVVAESPGPLADVTLRYKDLVYLRNGVARANLTLGEGPRTAGPLERNVLKNLVAWEFAQETRRAGRFLAGGEPRQAAAALASLRDLIRGLRHEVAGWQADPDLLADEALLEQYLTVLAKPAADDGLQRQYLADSLRYTAFRKLQTAAR